MKLLQKFEVLIFDMGGTFMFGNDRFGSGENFYDTYKAVGGTKLRAEEVTCFIRRCFDAMSRDYLDPNRYDDFFSLREALQNYAGAPSEELIYLEEVFAIHEFGQISFSDAELLRGLSKSHTLGLVSNIWAPKRRSLEEFGRSGLTHVFKHLVFSSDYRSIKPSVTLFQKSITGLGMDPNQALFIGDSLRCDMEGAKAVGLATAWITSAKEPHPCVDYHIKSIAEIKSALA